jgi:TPR repeat protein
MGFMKMLIKIYAVICMVVSTISSDNAQCEDNSFWVSPNGIEIVVQSEQKNETHYFNNDINRICYTFKVPGQWVPSSGSISLLQIRESESSTAVTLGSIDSVTTWKGSQAGIYIYSPRELGVSKGSDPISNAVAKGLYSAEKKHNMTTLSNEIVPFECSWPKAKLWKAEWSIPINGELTRIGSEKVFIDIGKGWVAQVTSGKPGGWNSGEQIRRFIESFETTAEPDCYLPYIHQNFVSEAGELAAGLMMFSHGDYSQALKNLRPLADQGFSQAQSALGRIYSQGLGISTDHKEAVHWLRLAAKQGESDAQYHLGLAYDHGRGVRQNATEAAKWYLASAEQNDPAAQYNLALMYSSGRGVPQDDAEAFKWYLHAAELGLPQAQYNVGFHYSKGISVPKDKVRAARWVLLAAEKGLTFAQIRIAYLYLVGEGVRRDIIESYAWYHVAAQSNTEAAKSRDSVLQQLSFMEKRRARKRAEELLKSVIPFQ